MAELIKRTWQSDLGGSGLPRKHRQSCEYEAYLPDPLIGRQVTLDGQVSADVTEAEAAIATLNVSATALVDTEALARILLRAEAVASSRIEGLEVGARRLLHAEVIRGLHEVLVDVTAAEVLGNIDAMVFGIGSVGPGDQITVGLLRDVHRRLLQGTRMAEHAGELRTTQNWIGGSGYNPCSAAFVPPPPEFVPDLMSDLCAFASSDDLPVVVQAAMAHAQFETIHPFADGNGRTGRALIHLVFRRRGLAMRILPPVSLILATWVRSYLDGLTGFRYIGDSSTEEALAGLNGWIGTFAAACSRAVADTESFEERSAQLEETWRIQVGAIRAGSATDLLLRVLPGVPVLTVDAAASLINRTFNPANEAIQRLVDAGILRQVTVGRRNRAFEAPEVIAAFTALERQLAFRMETPTPPRRRGEYRVAHDPIGRPTGIHAPGQPDAS
jgi:Fic family protein